jgi:type I restriction enzyme, S subunit
MVKLGEVLRPVSRAETVDAAKEYRLVGVRLDGQGPFPREIVSGSKTSAKTLYRIAFGDFIYSRLFACRGAFGVIESELDGCFVSGEFPTFLPVEQRLNSHFLRYWFRLPETLDRVNEDCSGSTPLTRNRFKEQFFMQLEIPLPPLGEQRRIVARIDELSAKIAEARSLRQQASEEAKALFEHSRSEIFEHSSASDHVRLQDIAVLERGKFSYRPRNDPRFFGGVHPWIQIAEIEGAGKFIRKYTETLNEEGLAISKKFPKGTVLISIAATIGATGILDFDCCVPDSIVGVTPRKDTDSEFLYHFLGYARGHLERIAPQSAQKNINLQILSPLLAPKLSLVEQRRIVGYLDGLQAKLDVLKHLQAQTAAELDALLPSVLDKAFGGGL